MAACIASSLAVVRAAPRVEPAADYLLPGASRTFEIIYTARVPSLPPGTHHLQLWLPVPRSSSVQTIRDLAFSPQPELAAEPRFGNEIAYWDLSAPRPGQQVTMRFTCTRREVQTNLAALRGVIGRPSPQFAAFVRPTAYATVDGRVARLAEEITAGKTTTVDQGRAIYDYVLAHMRYDKSQPGWGRGSTSFACDTGRGNCTDFHSLFNSLCRARGIAAAFEIGLYLPYTRGSDAPLSGYHCWTLFRVPGKTWVPVDCSEASQHPERRDYFFGDHTDNRVALSVGRDLDLVPRQHGPALNYFVDPYAEADGRPVAATKTWTYRDLDRPARVAAR